MKPYTPTHVAWCAQLAGGDALSALDSSCLNNALRSDLIAVRIHVEITLYVHQQDQSVPDRHC